MVIPLLAITVLIWIPLLLIGLLTEVFLLPGEWRFARQMQAKGRYLSPRKLKAHLTANGSGTLIVDSPTLGWGINRVWWIQEDIPSEAPMRSDESRDPPESRENFTWSPLDRWCWHHYLNPENGQATFIAGWHSRKLADSLAEKYPHVILLNCWSAGRFLDKAERGAKKLNLEAQMTLWDREFDG